MNMARLILFALQTSMFLSVLGLGLAATFNERWYLLRRPGRLARSLFSMNVVMPLSAAALAAGFNLYPAVKFALIVLAVSPVPPMLPGKQLKAGGHAAYVYGLLVATVLFAIVFVPAALAVLGEVFARPVDASSGTIAGVVGFQFLIPLSAGVAIRHFVPQFAERIAGRVSILATALLVISGVPLLFIAWPVCAPLIGNGTLAALSAFCVGGVAAGHLLGGPDPQDRTVLALSTASRHPAVAITIASGNFPEENSIFGALLLYLLVSTTVTLLYIAWSRRVTARTVNPRAAGGS
jgi:BASS family bile acid:Na+ symporter